MSTVTYKNSSGSNVGEMSLDARIFDVEPNIHLMYEAAKMYLANQRQGTVDVKSRSFVSGTTKKPFRQKGTGRARQGSHKVPHFRGGGIPFGPSPRDFSYSIPKKMKRQALFSALSAKRQDGEMIFLDEFTVEAPKTRLARNVLRNLGIDDKKILVVTDGEDRNVYLACRNLPNVNVIRAQNLNTYHVLNCEVVLMTRKAVERVEEVFG
ncbi:MAG: 50S ribosomal protein L4 [Gemmatimonadetes bacterium]|nr:MAG: 50S ribosomal protein L4 [Gemmatimonadota bacterium]